MKRNLVITGIALASFATFCFVLTNTQHKNRISSYTSSDQSQTAYSSVLNATTDSLISVSEIFKNLFYATNCQSGTIGSMGANSVDNPTDNTFLVTIDQEIDLTQDAYLEYELFGVKDFSSVCKGINDNVSTGGMFATVSNEWTSQSERIPISQLNTGANRIRFSVPENSEYGYKVKDVRIRFDQNTSGERRIVINQPKGHYYFKEFGFVSGFITGNGSANAKIYANGKLIRTHNAVFEGMIEKSKGSDQAWSAEMTAVYEDGQQISTTVSFNTSGSLDYASEYSPEVPFNEVAVNSLSAISLKVSGFELQGAPGAIVKPEILSVTGLRAQDMALIGTSMINVTGINRGFRCLPHGQIFNEEMEIRIKYDTSRIPIGYSPQDIRTYFYDETSGDWVQLPFDTVDIATNEIVSRTTHFTDFINAILKTPEAPLTQAFTPTSMKDFKYADPMAGYNVMAPPSANNTGSANMSLPIELPSGRQGMQPQLAISYNSNGDNSWLGVGWDLSTPAITVDTRWGVPHFFPDKESESYLLNGEELMPQVQRSEFAPRSTTNTKEFIPKVEGAFDKIIRHGTTPSTYWWEVFDKNGVRYLYGKYNSDPGPNSNCVLANSNNGNIAHWALAEVRDLNDNYVKYNYTVISNPASLFPGSNGKQIYPQSIYYTGSGTTDGLYKVEFIRNANARTDFYVSARYGFSEIHDQLLQQVLITYDNTFVRDYIIKYKIGAFGKTVVCFIADITNTVNINQVLNSSCSYNPGETSGCKVHEFSYYEQSEQAFADPVVYNAGSDDADMWILDGTIDVSTTPALSQSLTTGWTLGGSIDIGLGANVTKKNNSIGGSYTYNENTTKDYLMMTDINGDGLPDRVYKGDNGIYYRALRFVNETDLAYDVTPKQIHGLPKFGRSENFGDTWGIEGQFGVEGLIGIAASAAWTKMDNYAGRYFADVNADGYLDFIYDDAVYYNELNNEANPFFVKETSDVMQLIPGSGCNYILRSGEINDSVFTPPLGDEYDLRFDYSRDAVRVWVAPYNGYINIKSTVQLLEDTSYSRSISNLVDGVVYSIQDSGSVLQRENIYESDYTQHNWTSSSRLVKKGQKVYFRLQSKKDRKWDDVYWDPTIYYTQINGTAVDTNVVDAEGKKIALFRPSKDLLIYNKSVFQAPYSGKIRVNGTLSINSVSDSVRFYLKKGNTIIRQASFAGNTNVSYFSNDTINVAEGDDINLICYTKTDVDWNKISNTYKIYYYKADSATIDTTSAFNKIEVKPIMQYNMHQNTKQRSVANYLPVAKYTIQPSIVATSTTTGSILLAVKYNNQTYHKLVISIVNGVVVGNPVISMKLIGPKNVYFEYYCDSLIDGITQAKVVVNGEQRNAGLYSYIKENMWVFGNLYRGWGQFSYDDGDTNTFDALSESELHLSVLSQDTALITFDQSTINSFNSAMGSLNANGANDPLNEHFNMMWPDLNDMVWRDYARKGSVGKNSMSNSTLRNSSATQDTVYDSPLWQNINPGVPIRTAQKYWQEKTYAWSVSMTGIVGAGYAHNKTESVFGLDYLDMNGDQYPDVAGTNNIQYTTPQGGFFNNITPYVLSGTLEASDYVGSGYSYGVNLPFSTKPSIPLRDCSGAPTHSDYKTIVKKGGNLSVGGNTYIGKSATQFALKDVNGDGLPDKVDNIGNVFLNYGYSFGTAEIWGLDTVHKERCKSQGVSLGGGAFNGAALTEFVSSQYSWSGGVSLCWSKSNSSQVLIDINGDGFLDIVSTDFSDNNLEIQLNSGHGFAATAPWTNTDSIHYGRSLAGSANLAGTAGLTLFGIIKLVFNLQGSVTGSGNYEKLIITDFNNDGYPDIVTAEENDQVKVRYSKLGKVNLLKEVRTSTGSKYIVDYKLSTCDQDMPQRRYQLSSLKIFDGFTGDGQDTLYTKFSYAHGYYERFDRTFYGFDSVTTMQFDNFGPSGTCYRSTIEKYHNRDYLFEGLKWYEATLSGTTTKYVETIHTYNRKEIETGYIVPDSIAQCFGPYYPAISIEDKYYYNGLSTAQIHTKKKYTHGKYGNVIKYHNYGDMVDLNDDILAYIVYSFDTTKNILSMVDSVIAKDTNNVLLRKRSGIYNANGQVTQLTSYIGTTTAVVDLTYDAFGNIRTLALPENSNSQRMSYTYGYDQIVHTYPVQIVDALGYSSQTSYDYLLGLPTFVTDMSGNSMRYTYYDDGKIETIVSPKELAANMAYTIKFEYSDEMPPSDTIWARTLHVDPLSPSYINKFITLTTVDGLGRVIQTQKNIVDEGTQKWLISGKSFIDAYGRTNSTTLPTTAWFGNNKKYYDVFPSIYTTTTLDVLDRALLLTFPDQTQVSFQYFFDNDAFAIKRFATTITDPNSNSSTTYTSPQGLKTSITNPLSTITKFVYNPLGELLNSTDPESNVTNYLYDQSGRMISRQHPDAGTTTNTYDAAGNLLSVQTENLSQISAQINYDYDFNRLISVSYPSNPENNVYYDYGDPNLGNQTGKVVRMQDASGTQDFTYGNMGEVIQNIHTYAVPKGNLYAFEIQWVYDCWNRVSSILYPDGEIVDYSYNQAGQLVQMSGTKGTDPYSYVDSVFYDMYGSRTEIYYGNGTHCQYTYDPLNQQLTNLISFDVGNNVMQDLTYTYDDAKNITAIENGGSFVNGTLGGSYNYNYTYDDLYRLTDAYGSFDSYQNSNLPFDLEMEYSPSGNILNKSLSAQTLIGGTVRNVAYNNAYDYNDRPHNVTTAGNVDYEWDPNGNMEKRIDNNSGYERNLCWDEENRLTTVRNISGELNSNLSSYIYNGGGERVWKLTGEVQTMLLNGQTTIDIVNYDKTLYSSPYMVMTDQEYTKHYYIEGERVCSKIGSGFGLVSDPISYAVPAIEGEVEVIPEMLWQMVERGINCASFLANNVYFKGDLKPAGNKGTEREDDRYFYHSDHIGSSSFITNISGNAIQHLQYLPFGETFIDQQNGGFDSRYKFSGKEKDNETSYSYFGARYYDSDLSVWLSVDPMASKYPDVSSYSYVGNRPINMIDPDGADEIEVVRQRNGKMRYNRLSRMGGNKTQIIKYTSENEKGEHLQSLEPYAFIGTRKQLRESIENSSAWIMATNTPVPYNPTAAYALDDIAQRAALEVAVLIATDGLFEIAGALVAPLVRSMYASWVARVAAKGGEGVYDLGTTLGKYVGQSKDIMGRVISHFAKGGKLSAGELKNAVFHSMPGSTKLQREVYEQFLINKYGINNLLNVRNPMGGRMDLYNNMVDDVIKQFGLPR